MTLGNPVQIKNHSKCYVASSMFLFWMLVYNTRRLVNYSAHVSQWVGLFFFCLIATNGINFILRSFGSFLSHSHPADFPDTVFARHGESSAAVRPAGSREIRLAHGEWVLEMTTNWWFWWQRTERTNSLLLLHNDRTPLWHKSFFWGDGVVHRLRMVRSTLALTKRMVWSASMTTLKNTTILQCSTKSIKRLGEVASQFKWAFISL